MHRMGLKLHGRCVAMLCIAAMAGKAWAAEPPGARVLTTADAQASDPPVVTAVAIHPGGGLVASAGDDHLVRIWNVATGGQVRSLRDTPTGCAAWPFDPSGRSLASAGDDASVKIWDLEAGQTVQTLGGSGHPLFCLAYYPNGSMLAAAGFDGHLRLYDTRSGQLTHTLDCPDAEVRALAISPDGKLLAAGGRNGHVRIWNADDCRMLRDLEAHRQRVRAIAFSEDGRRTRLGRRRPPAANLERQRWQREAGRAQSLREDRNACVLQRNDARQRHHRQRRPTLGPRIQNRTSEAGRPHRQRGRHGLSSATRLLVTGSFDTTVRLWTLPAGE